MRQTATSSDVRESAPFFEGLTVSNSVILGPTQRLSSRQSTERSEKRQPNDACSNIGLHECDEEIVSFAKIIIDVNSVCACALSRKVSMGINGKTLSSGEGVSFSSL
ncbi:hypothetical protein QA640_40240 [Bradyrhizobium sp. CB82]|uniref:hypothetical protein n=1 Tax=Bradyrhizobium sp. CB82 TaxID=3039159 RepID=UPI0024B1F910|nr:hypothetical protein [Bradyrhizobium sp. CB82]WFU40345.1 hypothetical protein QA640_40240 [Bradyrhizobium sp. CB82]